MGRLWWPQDITLRDARVRVYTWIPLQMIWVAKVISEPVGHGAAQLRVQVPP